MPENFNKSRRSFLEATGGAATAVALTDPAHTRETTRRETDSQGTLNLINATMSSLDPVKSTDAASGTVLQQVFDALTNYPDGEVEVETQLAENFEQSDDFRTYTFTLRQEARFHNGAEVTARDFVYSWERLADSDNSRRAYFILDSLGVEHETDSEDDYRPGSLAVEAVDEYTLAVTLAEPFHSALEILAYTPFAAVPEGLVGDIDGYDGEMEYREFATSNPIGAGPFQFERWAPNDEAEVTRFADYHGETAQVEAVNWRIIEDDNARYTYAMNQNADVFSIPTQFYVPDKVSVESTDGLGREVGTYGPVRNGETVNYLAVATISAVYLGFNTELVEKPARQAVAYALNQRTAVEEVGKGRGQPAYHVTPPNIYPGGPDAYDQHATENYPYGYNETKLRNARQVMAEAGYGPNDRYEFTVTTFESQTWQELLEILRDKLVSAHIDLTIETAPFSTLIQRGREGGLEAYTLGWTMDWPAPDSFLQLLNPPQTDTSQSAPISYVNWSGTEAAQRATQAWKQIQDNPAPTDQAEAARNEAYVQMEEANWQDVVFLTLFHPTSERFWYDYVSIPKFGSAGEGRQMYNSTTLD